MQASKESQPSINNKVASIDLYLAGVERDLAALTEEQEVPH